MEHIFNYIKNNLLTNTEIILMSDHQIIVPGGLNTDIIAAGVQKILKAGELALGGELKIGPGGKARNMAQMASTYLGPGKVAMIGRSSRDPLGFWRYPIDSLKRAGVDSTHVNIMDYTEANQKYPGIALIPVDREGRNQIYVLPGVNEEFNRADIDKADTLFRNPTHAKMLMMALEIPLDTAYYAIQKAHAANIRVVLDPGGISNPIDEILDEKIFLLKPNEHETEILTGQKVTDFASARTAAEILLKKGIQNVFITHGARGGYLISAHVAEHIEIPRLSLTGPRDETGCGDQVTAMVTVFLAEGQNLLMATRHSILAGTLQFYRSGIQPIEREILDRYI
jgi:ribokinase